jgi:hypothetical protein
MRALTCTIAASALIAAAPAAAAVDGSASTASPTDAKAWCQAVIDTNTKAGTMKNKRYLSVLSLPPGAWKKVVDAADSGGERFIALAPSSIRTAVKHEIAWFRRIKANHYSNQTPLGSFSLSDNKKITNFEKTQCGITFST